MLHPRSLSSLLLVAATLLCSTSHAQGTKPAPPPSSVKVNEQKVVLVRSADAERSAGVPSREFVLRFPAVQDAGPAASKIEEALNPDSVWSDRGPGLVDSFVYGSGCESELGYEILFNQKSLLQVEYTLDTMCAYPDRFTKRRLVDVKTGEVLLAKDLFKPASLQALAGIVDRALQAEIKKALESLPKDEARENFVQLLSGHQFKAENLDDFAVGDQGVTFFYDYRFPHVAKAGQPPGKFVIRCSELKPHLAPQGPLAPVCAAAR